MTWMEKEILETPDVIAKQAENATLAELSERFAQQPPSGLLTVGRGNFRSCCRLFILPINALSRVAMHIHSAVIKYGLSD